MSFTSVDASGATLTFHSRGDHISGNLSAKQLIPEGFVAVPEVHIATAHDANTTYVSTAGAAAPTGAHRTFLGFQIVATAFGGSGSWLDTDLFFVQFSAVTGSPAPNYWQEFFTYADLTQSNSFGPANVYRVFTPVPIRTANAAERIDLAIVVLRSGAPPGSGVLTFTLSLNAYVSNY